MKYTVSVLSLVLCLAIMNGCGAARPSKFYQLTVPNERISAEDPATIPWPLLLGTDFNLASLSRRPYCVHFKPRSHGHVRIREMGRTTLRNDL